LAEVVKLVIDVLEVICSVLDGTTILTKALHSFPQSIVANARKNLKIGYGRFLPHPFPVIHYHPITRRYVVRVNGSVVK
jgi:hypothetical protein